MITSAVQTSIQLTSPLFGTGAGAADAAADAASAAGAAAAGADAAAEAAASCASASSPKPSSARPRARIVMNFFMGLSSLLRRASEGVLAGLAGADTNHLFE